MEQEKDKLITKVYYSIGEVAELLNVSASLIRYWESEFDQIKPRKNRKGNRQFTTDDIDNLKTIYFLVKEQGYTLQGARYALKKGTSEVKNKMELMESLKKVRSFLIELRDQIE